MTASRSRASSRTSSCRAAMSMGSGLLDPGHREGQRLHGSGSSFSDRSSAGAECVSAPTDTQSTPVLAAARIVSSVMPPLASSVARPATCATASRSSAGRHVVEQQMRRRRPRARRRSPRCSGTRPRAARPGAPRAHGASPRPRRPAIATWLFLISIWSHSPMRWFVPPPGGHRRLLEHPQPGRRLARVEHARARALDRLHVAGRQGGDAAQLLHEVQGGALGGEDRLGEALDDEHRAARRSSDPRARAARARRPGRAS